MANGTCSVHIHRVNDVVEVLPTLLESQEMPATCTEHAGSRTVGASLSSSQLSTHAYAQIFNKYVLTKYFMPDTYGYWGYRDKKDTFLMELNEKTGSHILCHLLLGLGQTWGR